MNTSLWIAIAVAIGVTLVVIFRLLSGRSFMPMSNLRGQAESPKPSKTPAVEVEQLRSSPPSPDTHIDKNVQFTVYRPATIVPNKEYTLVAFAHLSKRRADAPKDEPDPVAEVRRLAKKILSDQPAQYEPAKLDRGFSVPHKGFLLFVPAIEGCTFNPPTQSVQWLNSVQKVEFGMTASEEVDGRDVEGKVTVYLGTIYLTEIPIRITVDSKYVVPEFQEGVLEETSAEPYRDIFASYSRKDTRIVEDFEAHVQALGDRYLRDVKSIRAGEVWCEKLEELIREASVFQLFWSSNSMISPFVKQEWEYALGLNRENFIRPVYWEEPLPKREPDLPPATLSRLNFYKFPTGGEKKRAVVPPAIDRGSLADWDIQGSPSGPRSLKATPGPDQFMSATVPTSGAAIKGVVALVVFAALAAAAIYIGYRIIRSDPGEPPRQDQASPNPTPTATVGAGGASPSTPTITPTPSPSPSLTPSPSPTPTPTPSPTPTPTPTPSPTPTATPTPLPPGGSAIRVSIDPAVLTSRTPVGTYRVVIANVGSDVIRQIEIKEALPRDVEYVTSDPPAASEGQLIFWRVAEIYAKKSTTITVKVRLKRRLKPGETYEPKQNTIITYLDSQGNRHTYRPANQ